jgi:hypothetical protein
MSLWSKNKKFSFEYNEETNNKNTNYATEYARTLIKSDIEKTQFDKEYEEILNNGCIYLKNFFCKTDDKTLFNTLKKELDIDNNIIDWNKHSKCENPQISETFNIIVNKLSENFNMEIVETRLNYYKDGHSYKTYHHDKNAYGDVNENFTVGASFGATRNLDFKHVNSKNKFCFPQNNGDIFAFSKDINQKFLHAIPKSNKNCGDRISIICWGRVTNSI